MAGSFHSPRGQGGRRLRRGDGPRPAEWRRWRRGRGPAAGRSPCCGRPPACEALRRPARRSGPRAKATSRTQGHWVSLPQWPRQSVSSAPASARSGGTLVTAEARSRRLWPVFSRTTSRSRHRAWARPGPSLEPTSAALLHRRRTSNRPLREAGIEREDPSVPHHLGQQRWQRAHRIAARGHRSLGQDHAEFLAERPSRWTAGTVGWRLPRSTLPSMVTAAGPSASDNAVLAAAVQAPTARSKAATSRRVKTRCSVATHGVRSRVKPKRWASGAPAWGSRPHAAIASMLSPPASPRTPTPASRPADGAVRTPDADPARPAGTASTARQRRIPDPPCSSSTGASA